MTQTQIEKKLEEYTGSPFITRNELAGLLGYKKAQRVTERFLIGLEAVNGTRFLISEVAERIKSSCQIVGFRNDEEEL